MKNESALHAATRTARSTANASIRDSLRALKTPLQFLKGIGPARAAQLAAFGLNTIEDLLYHLPFRYEDRRGLSKIREAPVGEATTFVGRLVGLSQRYIPRRRMRMLNAVLEDDTGRIALVWYRAPSYLVDGLAKGQTLMVHGKVEPGRGGLKEIAHPEFEVVDPDDPPDHEKILPVYERPEGIPLKTIQKWIGEAVDAYAAQVPSFLPPAVAKKYGFRDVGAALARIHRPEKSDDLEALNASASAAHRAVVHDEFFYLQLGLALRRQNRTARTGIAFTREKKSLTQKMWEMLPFRLTRAQENVLHEIAVDMAAPRPMQRLLQGDVGSGKTIVGWFAALRAIENGFQAVWMAPTELLAEQHYRNLKDFAEQLAVPTALLTGSMAARTRNDIVRQLKDGRVSFVIGTHAVIQDNVQVPRLGLGIIDEQHRFGVLQRMALQKLAACRAATDASPEPDILLMSATPIPRSLAMVLYGDLEISWLNESPPGRMPVETRLVRSAARQRVYELVCDEVRKGRQAYVVYPLVESSEKLELRDATSMAAELSRGAFKDCRVALIHGRMAAAERDETMRRFKAGDIDILVATTVIEVGIDVSNATVMVIEHAERFGLSQLHQLRGRVGRGRHASHCLLIFYGGSSEALERLRVMERERDGFKIAEADLQLRGPGELIGTRQSGLADFRLANLARDSRLLLEAREEALAWLDKDPRLSRPESRAMKAVLKHRWGGRLELGNIG